jgi:tryptophanyl-tRNA synthetase
VDSGLLDTYGKTTQDDYLEGTPTLFAMRTCLMNPSQSRLIASRNVDDPSEVDETLLNAGLFTYPILQAADILAYK